MMMQVRWSLKPTSGKENKTLAASFNPITERLKAHRDFDRHAQELAPDAKRPCPSVDADAPAAPTSPSAATFSLSAAMPLDAKTTQPKKEPKKKAEKKEKKEKPPGATAGKGGKGGKGGKRSKEQQGSSSKLDSSDFSDITLLASVEDDELFSCFQASCGAEHAAGVAPGPASPSCSTDEASGCSLSVEELGSLDATDPEMLLDDLDALCTDVTGSLESEMLQQLASIDALEDEDDVQFVAEIETSPDDNASESGGSEPESTTSA